MTDSESSYEIPTWGGVVRRGQLKESFEQVRDAISSAAKSYDWQQLLALLSHHPDLVNSTRLEGTSLFGPLHQAAHGGAPLDVVRRLLDLGAFRTLVNSRGERPVDTARRKGHRHLVELLEPVLRREVPIRILLKVQALFHGVIHSVIDEPLPDHSLRLPELEPLLELERPVMWFPVPGMFGGFRYSLEADGVEPRLVTANWSRIVEGPIDRHEITSAGVRRLPEE